jgi:hypothetical protein
MKIYAYIIFSLYFVQLGVSIGDPKSIGRWVTTFGLAMPLIGRVIGWW